MNPPIVALLLLLLGQTAEPSHSANPVYRFVTSDGLKVGETLVKLPSPSLGEDTTPESERDALAKIAGSDRDIAELTRDSVSAPFVLKTRDEPVAELGIIRVVDLWFVVHAGLDEIDPESLEGHGDEPRTVEAANMRFTARRVAKNELAKRAIKDEANGHSWYVHLSGRLLDRLAVEATDRLTATKDPTSWLLASRTDPAFDEDKELPNNWSPIKRTGSSVETGNVERYPGGMSYVKITKLATVEGALLVESHLAFFEPKAWFDGAPILRSKFGIVAQDRIRGLRRELAKSRKAAETRTGPGTKGG